MAGFFLIAVKSTKLIHVSMMSVLLSVCMFCTNKLFVSFRLAWAHQFSFLRHSGCWCRAEWEWRKPIMFWRVTVFPLVRCCFVHRSHLLVQHSLQCSFLSCPIHPIIATKRLQALVTKVSVLCAIASRAQKGAPHSHSPGMLIGRPMCIDCRMARLSWTRTMQQGAVRSNCLFLPIR